MTYANAIERQELINGLRQLAGFLERNLEVPAPKYTDVLVFSSYGTDSENRREIDAIAARIGSGIELSPVRRHYSASRQFGPVEYRAVAIPSDQTLEP